MDGRPQNASPFTAARLAAQAAAGAQPPAVALDEAAPPWQPMQRPRDSAKRDRAGEGGLARSVRPRVAAALGEATVSRIESQLQRFVGAVGEDAPVWSAQPVLSAEPVAAVAAPPPASVPERPAPPAPSSGGWGSDFLARNAKQSAAAVAAVAAEIAKGATGAHTAPLPLLPPPVPAAPRTVPAAAEFKFKALFVAPPGGGAQLPVGASTARYDWSAACPPAAQPPWRHRSAVYCFPA